MSVTFVRREAHPPAAVPEFTLDAVGGPVCKAAASVSLPLKESARDALLRKANGAKGTLMLIHRSDPNKVYRVKKAEVVENKLVVQLIGETAYASTFAAVFTERENELYSLLWR